MSAHQQFSNSTWLQGDFAEQLAEGEDQLILQYLVEQGLGIFPVNVTEADQRTSLQTWISNLLPVQYPQDQMEPWNGASTIINLHKS